MHTNKVIKSVKLLVLAVGLAAGLLLARIAFADSAPPTTDTTPSPTANAPTAAAVSAAAIGSGFTEVPGTRYFTVLDGSKPVHINYVAREALFRHVLSVFKVDDTTGAINSVEPWDAGWPAAVAARNPQVVFDSAAAGPGASADTTFNTGDILAFRFTVVDLNTSYYSFDQANPDGRSHMLAYQGSTGQPWQMGWEDWGDFDFNDMIVNVSNVQGGGTSSVPPPTGTTPPTVDSFTANSPWLWSNGSVTLSWTSTNASGCSISSSPSSGGAASALSPNGSWTTPALSADTYTWTLTCSNTAGNATATMSVGVFSSKDQVTGSVDSGQNMDPVFTRSIQAPPGCRWKSESNETVLKTQVGLRAGGLQTQVSWCVRGFKILKVVRTISVIGPNYPLSGWKFDGITSYGPCDENCSNYVSLYGINRTEINIWVQGHWSLCISLPVVGSLCAQQAYRTVGVLIRGDGTRDDTYNS